MIHGMSGMCTVEATRNILVARIFRKLKESGVEKPDDIQISFPGEHVFDGNGTPSSFCIVYISPAILTKDLVLLIRTLKHELALDSRVMLSNLGPVPKG